MIRKATREDIASIAAIYDAIHAAESSGSMRIGWKKGIYPVAQTALDGLARGDLYVEEVDGRVVASAMMNHDESVAYADNSWLPETPDPSVYVLHTMVVDPKEAGKGYAQAFFQYYEAHARELGCSVLRVDTQEKNLTARALYEKLGFQLFRIVDTTIEGQPGIKLYCLEKKL